jgi:PST family polysaccharide transporter
MFAVSDDLIAVLLGPQWKGAAPVFRWLALAAVAQPIAAFLAGLMLSRGEGRRYVVRGLINDVASIASFVIGLPWGAGGVARAYGLCNLALIGPNIAWAVHGTPVSARDIAEACVWPGIVSACGIVGVWGLKHSGASFTPAQHVFAAASVFGVLTMAGLVTVGRRDLAFLLRLRSDIAS